MNAAPVHETPWGRVVAASECGHISMPVRTEQDFRLARFVESHGPHAHGFAGDAFDPRERFAVRVAEVVEDGDVVASLQQFHAGVRTDVAGAAGYQDFFGHRDVIHSREVEFYPGQRPLRYRLSKQ